VSKLYEAVTKLPSGLGLKLSGDTPQVDYSDVNYFCPENSAAGAAVNSASKSTATAIERTAFTTDPSSSLWAKPVRFVNGDKPGIENIAESSRAEIKDSVAKGTDGVKIIGYSLGDPSKDSLKLLARQARVAEEFMAAGLEPDKISIIYSSTYDPEEDGSVKLDVEGPHLEWATRGPNGIYDPLAMDLGGVPTSR
jgi:hypothetical protein